MPALDETDPASSSAALRRLRPLIPVAAIAAMLIGIYITGWQRHLSLETFVDHRAAIDAFVAAHRRAALLAFVGLYAAATAGAIPAGAVLAMIGGFLFGAIVGGVGAMAGSTAGATILFLIARSAIGEPLARAQNPLIGSLAAGFRADAFNYILFLRLIPSPSWLTSAAAGSLRVRLSVFVGATALGRVPGSFLFALFGSGLGGLIGAREASYRACLAAGGADCRIDIGPAAVLTPAFLAGLLGLALLALVPVLAKRLLMRRARIAARPESP